MSDLFNPRAAWQAKIDAIDFDGETYEEKHDRIRLTGQTERVYSILSASIAWLTLSEIRQASMALKTNGDPEASISARIRDLRKSKFGRYRVERRRRGDPKAGLFEYKMEQTNE